MCGADFPLKVAALGESSPAISYSDDLRPPGSIPGNSAQMPRWPINEPRYAPPAPVGSGSVQSAQTPSMRWVPGPPPAQQPRYATPDQPISLSPPGSEPGVTPSAGPLPDDIPDDAVVPRGRAPAAYTPQRAYGAPTYQPPQQRAAPAPAPSLGPASGPSLGPLPGRSLGPSLGPSRAPQMMAAAGPATLTPAATLACPIVSALDHWVSEGVQPAAMRWFGAQVVEIKQISAYSCRGMVGSGGSGISEHAFGNAIDIAAFTLADGRRITVQEGWHGSPEEQGFLHDVHLAACDNFTTVLAPGYNAAHYNHIHVDLMRRSSGDRPCRPEAISGEVAAAQARAVYARQHGPAYTGSSTRPAARRGKSPVAVPGEDGDVDFEYGDELVTGSLAAPSAASMSAPSEIDESALKSRQSVRRGNLQSYDRMNVH